MKSFFDKFKWMLLFIGIATFIDFMVMSDIILSVSFPIAGLFTEEDVVWPVIFPYLIISSVYFSLFGWFPWRYHRLRSDEGRREYLEKLGAGVFDRNAEKENRKRDKEFKKEIWAYAFVNIFAIAFMIIRGAESEEALFVILGLIFSLPFTILTFWLFDRKFYLDLREAWARERIRLNPNKPED